MRSCLVILCLAVCGCHARPAVQKAGRIVFTSTRDGHPQIYAVNPDGSDLHRLTNSESQDDFPLWAPDGRHISFLSNRGGNWDLWIMNADGSGPRRLTNTPSADEHSPAWSPSGKSLAFATDRDGGDWEIYTVDLDGKNPRNLTHSHGMDYSPNWSPDGKSIVFVSERDGNADLYIMNADGSNQRRVTNDPTREALGTAAWSPDGHKLVYMAAENGQIEIMVREIEHGLARQLTRGNAPVWNPNAGPPVNVSAGWSPDGSSIVFVTGALRGGQASSQLMIMDDGGHARPLLPHSSMYADYAPHWRS